jgi:uncharacterized phage protein (TIGR01671 family)
MRSIKFRAFVLLDNGCSEDDRAHYQEKVMFDVAHMGFDEDELCHVTICDDVFRDGEDIEYPIEDVKLMQYTGLKDKNNVDIYEGSVVLFGDNVIHGGTHGKVIWSESKAGFVYEFINGKYKGKCTNLQDGWRTEEVIGNIHENPTLLDTLP